MSEGKIRIIIPEVMTDGEHWSPIDNPDDLGELVRQFMVDMGDDLEGEELTIKFRRMTDAEVEELPEI